MERWLILCLLTLGWGTGCGGDKEKNNASPPPSPYSGQLFPRSNSTLQATPGTNLPPEITNAQPRLPAIKLLVGADKKAILAEQALEPLQQQTGMMFRKTMGKDEGMLFVFPEPKQAGFYMKNTFVKMTAAYIGSSGRILELHDLEPLEERSVFSRSALVRYVLEAPRGWFEANDILEGDLVITERGTLQEFYFTKRKP